MTETTPTNEAAERLRNAIEWNWTPVMADLDAALASEYQRGRDSFILELCNCDFPAGAHTHDDAADTLAIERGSAAEHREDAGLPSVDDLYEALWAERDRLDGGVDGFNEVLYRRAARAILARLLLAPRLASVVARLSEEPDREHREDARP